MSNIPAQNIPARDVESLSAQLRYIHAQVKDLEEEEILESSSSKLQALFKFLDEFAALEIEEKVANGFLKNQDFSSLFAGISRFRYLYNLKLEIEEAKSLLTSSSPWETLQNFIFYPNYLQLAQTEYQGSDLKPGESVLFLGSGPLPLSLIVLCHEYGLKGIGIEREGLRADLSREVIARLGLSKTIQILEGTHLILPLKPSPALYMVAAQAEPKKEVFEHLAKRLPREAKVSYRLYEKGLRRMLDESSLLELPAGFEEYLRVQPAPPVNNTVVFLKRV